jgi:hypothetical protein
MAKHEHPLFGRWSRIQQTCANPNHPEYFRYGARGIENHFANFREFKNYIENKLGTKPPGFYVLGRIDKSGHFAPGNLQWETATERGRNSPRQNVIAQYGHRKRSLAEWAELLQIPYWTLRRRYRDGYKIREIIKEFQ